MSIIDRVKEARKSMNVKEDLSIKDKILSDGLSTALDNFKAKGWDGEGELMRAVDRVNGTWSDEDLVAYLSVMTGADLAANMADRMIEQQAISRPSWLGFCAQRLLQRCFLSYARTRRMAEESSRKAADNRERGDSPYAGTSNALFDSDSLRSSAVDPLDKSRVEDWDVTDPAYGAMDDISRELSELYEICRGLAAEPLRPLSLSMDKVTMDIDEAFQLYSAFVAEFKARSKREYVTNLKAQNKAALNSGVTDAPGTIHREAKRLEDLNRYEKELARSLREGKVPERGEFVHQTAEPSDDLEVLIFGNGAQ